MPPFLQSYQRDERQAAAFVKKQQTYGLVMADEEVRHSPNFSLCRPGGGGQTALN